MVMRRMICDEWRDADIRAASEAFDGVFADGVGLGVWTAAADTTREWGGGKKGLSVVDTRHTIKNNAEYHGMEVYAWQYMTTAQYQYAADHFFSAAYWREVDLSAILDNNPGVLADAGHLSAISACIRMARFATALSDAQRGGWSYPLPEEFGLEDEWVSEREQKAQRVLDSYLRAP
jgi:hypothetical protein